MNGMPLTGACNVVSGSPAEACGCGTSEEGHV